MIAFDEISRLINEGYSNRQIAKLLNCCRRIISSIRKGTVNKNTIDLNKDSRGRKAVWTESINWDKVEENILKKDPLKFIWEAHAQTLTSYSSFLRYVNKRFEDHFKKSVSIRVFNPGEYCEIDYAGDTIPWFDSTGKQNKAAMFVGILCYSQKIYAIAVENQKINSWLLANKKMFEFFGGVPKVLRPDNLKAATTRSHLYDPLLNPSYIEFAKHYGTNIVPARVRKPQDKALAENAVKLLQRYFKFVTYGIRFTSIDQINKKIEYCVNNINNKTHTKFKVSRESRFQEKEKESLQSLPKDSFENIDWLVKKAIENGTIEARGNFYTVPYQWIGEILKIKITLTTIEIYRDNNRIGMHQKVIDGSKGKIIIDYDHLSPKGRAFLETEPKALMSAAKCLNRELGDFVEQMLTENPLGNLRKATGLINVSKKFMKKYPNVAELVSKAICMYRIRSNQSVSLFSDLLKVCLNNPSKGKEKDKEIIRKPGNPMLRIITGGIK